MFKYFNKKQDDLQGVGVFGDPGLASAVRKDVSGIGFNNIGYIYDAKTKTRRSLRELRPDEGRHDEPEISCGVHCMLAEDEISHVDAPLTVRDVN